MERSDDLALPRIRVRVASAASCFGAGRSEQVAAIRSGATGLVRRPGSGPVGEDAVGAWIPAEVAGDRDPFGLLERVVERLVEDGGLSARDRREAAVFVGTSGGLFAIEDIREPERPRSAAEWRAELRSRGPGGLAAHLAARLGCLGPVATFTTACTSTSVALLAAARAIRQGIVPRAIVAGIDRQMGITIRGFRLLHLYSEDVCRPFDRDRDGMQLGEGCAAIVLEAGDAGRFEWLDGAIGHDPSHVAAGSNDGAAAAWVMERALERSAVSPRSVLAVKAHGTGTFTNDLSELRGMRAVFGDSPPPFSSLKGMLGHTAGTSGILEMVLWLWCAAEGFVPFSRGFRNPIEETGLSPLRSDLELPDGGGVHIFNAFGFGGTTVSYLVADHGGSA